MLNQTPPKSDPNWQQEAFKDLFREGFEDRAVELVIKGYRRMCKEGLYNFLWDEERFSAVLVGCIDKSCQMFARLTHQVWDVQREHYKDNEQIQKGERNPRAVPRIDIVIFNWSRIGAKKRRFSFECKLLDDQDANLIRLYIREGLIDRYLNGEKDYSAGLPWGGMIGYIRRGNHDIIATKLNSQIDRQLNPLIGHLDLYKLIADFDAIYRSKHQHPNQTKILTIMHLLLTFRSQISIKVEDVSQNIFSSE